MASAMTGGSHPFCPLPRGRLQFRFGRVSRSNTQNFPVLATPLIRLWNQAAPAQAEVAGSAQPAAAVFLDPHSDGPLLFASQATGREENIMLASAVAKNIIVRFARALWRTVKCVMEPARCGASRQREPLLVAQPGQRE
jgi:hypothetical protein